MRKTKKAVSALALTLAASTLFVGCGDSGTGATTAAAQETEAQETTEAAETSAGETETKDEEDTNAESTETEAENTDTKIGNGETLLIGIQTNALVTDYEDNFQTKKLEEDLGINIEFYMLPASADDCKTKLSLMATGGEALPDIIMVDGVLSAEQVLDYGSKGIFVPLNDYIADESMCPYFSAIPEEDMETIMTAITSADGNIYCLPKFETSTWNMTPNRYYINGAWLDKLGLEVPTTTDELYEVLKHFVQDDPNGNGKADEIGVYGMMEGGYGQNTVAALMNSFLFWNGGGQNGGLALDESGETVIAPFTQDAFREGLRYMNKLYSEGLMPSAIFTDDDTQFKAVLNAETPVVGLVCAGSTSNWNDCDNNPNFLELDIMSPLTGPEGVCYTPYTEYSPTLEFFITSACENPELAFRFGDYFYKKDISMMARFGEEGVDWTMDPEVCAEFTNCYVEAGITDAISIVYNYKTDVNVWAEPSNKFWHGTQPRYSALEWSNGEADGSAPYDPSKKSATLNAYNYEHYYDKHPEHVLPMLHYTLEESSQLGTITSDVPELVNSAIAEFITGNRSLEDDGWNAYLSELETSGLSQWLEAAQNAYDRSAGNN